MRQYTVCFDWDIPVTRLVETLKGLADGQPVMVTVGQGRYLNDLPEGWILVEKNGLHEDSHRYDW